MNAIDELRMRQAAPMMLEALRFYAERDHFILSDDSAWDTVSGEPQNFWCDEAGTATVEDGSIARAAIAAATEGAAPAAPRDDAETVARAFHEAYERLAPTFGYETRPESAKPWEDVPANQRALMAATVAEVLNARPAPEAPGELTDERIAELAERMEASDPADSFWKEFARAVEIEVRAAIAAGTEGAAPAAPLPEPVADDLSALVARLARALRKAAPEHDLPAKALDYLKRKGLEGSPLRDAPAQPAQDAAVEQPEG